MSAKTRTGSAKTRTGLAVAGCLCLFAGMASAQDVTYAEDVAPILMDNCVTCHRPGEVAPMSLLTYEDARKWARLIALEVSEKRMPPWHAAPGLREYTNDRSLDDAEIEAIQPQRLPAGSVAHMEATFDNSPESPYQHSNPPQLVTFGEATTDEMAVAVFFHTRDAENLSSGSSSR